MTNGFGSLQTLIGELSVQTDPMPPVVEWVEANARGDRVIVRFSEAVALPSATNLSNYLLAGGPVVASAVRQSDGRTVQLATTPQASGAHYGLTVRDVTDVEGNRMVAAQSVAFPTFVEQTGQVAREVWRGDRIGLHLESLTDLPAYKSGNPSVRELWRGIGTPENAGDHYGQRLWGWIVPAVTGVYQFAISADESAALYLGEDDARENLLRAAYVPQRTGPREWMKYPSQLSYPRTLEAGKAYAFEALMTEGVGADHLSLGWIQPGQAVPEVIGEEYLRLRLDPRELQAKIVAQPESLATWQQVGGVFQVRAEPGRFALGPMQFQWQRNGTDIPDAIGEEYRLPVPLDPSIDHGAKYRCAVTDAAGNRVVSAEAELMVRPQTEPVLLTLSPAGGTLTLTWPGEPGLRLQQSTRLWRPDWRDVPGTIGASRAELPLSRAAGYFRLVRLP